MSAPLVLDLPDGGSADQALIAAATAPDAAGATIAPPRDKGAAPAGDRAAARQGKRKGGRPAGRKDSKPRRRAGAKPADLPADGTPVDRLTRDQFAQLAGEPAAQSGPISGPGLPPAPPDPARLAEMTTSIATVAGVLFDLLAIGYGDHWKLSTEQRGVIGTALAPIAVRHLPPDASGAAPYVAAAVIVAGVVVPRVRETRKLRAAPRATPAPADATPPNQAPQLPQPAATGSAAAMLDSHARGHL